MIGESTTPNAKPMPTSAENVDRGHPEEATATRHGDQKILLGALAVGTAVGVYENVCGTSIHGVLLAE